MRNLKFRINFLIKQVDSITKDIDGKSLEEFCKSDLLVRATCFSIVQIGEQMIRLEEELGGKYKDLPWREARNMRNLIVHIYNKVDGYQIYDTAVNDLPKLKAEFIKIRKDLFG